MDFGVFLLALAMVYLLPGPDMLLLLHTGASRGGRTALVTALGLATARGCHVVLAGAGLALLFRSVPWTFDVVRLAGRRLPGVAGAAHAAERSRRSTPRKSSMQSGHYLRQTMLITLLNPKAIVFYMAFLPLFIDPVSHQGLVTFAFMAVTVAVVTFLYGMAAVLLTHKLAERMRANPRVANLLERLAGACLLGFGIKLAAMR